MLDISEDIFVIITGIGITIVHTAFVFQYLEWTKFLEDLLKFTKDKKPTELLTLIKSGNKYTKIFIIYMFFGCIMYGLLDFKVVKICHKIKEDYHLDQLLCGMYIPLWLPFLVHKNFIPLLYATQLIVIYLSLLGCAVGIFLIWQAARIVGLHIDILTEEFATVCQKEHSFNKDSFVKWIQYHNYITESVLFYHLS